MQSTRINIQNHIKGSFCDESLTAGHATRISNDWKEEKKQLGYL